ncbi:MAG: GntR family transcriptional regulator [Anaerolineae bacterium]|nr:GntR family transcriptional regulator [Anaerolineae bacterium]
MQSFSRIQPISLREQVVQQIRTAIIEGQLKPGDHIVESSLTDQLGVSRTPVREALILLEREGLVVSEANRGSFVRAFTLEDVSNIFSMRVALENATGEACIDKLEDDDYAYLDNLIERQKVHITAGNHKEIRSIDVKFHRFLVEKSENPLINRFWSEIVAQIAALLNIRAEAIPDYNEYLAISDHTSIVVAYRQRDLDALKAANKRINDRVASECRLAIEMLGG